MAIAFYIPDQATLLRKATEQEQQILRMRVSHWKFLARIMYDALCQYVIDSTAISEPTFRSLSSGRKNSKLRKPSQ